MSLFRIGAPLVAALALLIAGPAQANTLVDNIDGISIDEDGKVTRFAAMVIDDEGRIAEILSRRNRRPEGIAYREDGRGRTVIPGFIDSHVHVMSLGLARLSLDLSGARSLEEALSLLAAYAEAQPDRPWLIGRGWNHAAWGLGRFPTAAELDAAVSDRPVWLASADGHAGWANSAALAAAGIAAASDEPAGGRAGRQGHGAG